MVGLSNPIPCNGDRVEAQTLDRILSPPVSQAGHAHAKRKPRSLELADVVEEHGAQLQSLTTEQARALKAIASCRSALLGGHLLRCDTCGETEVSFNSCRNRHCPKCQGLSELRWVESRQKDLLPVEYFHVVFTLPDSLHGFFRANPAKAYGLLFSAVSETLLEVAANPKRLGARVGFLSVLHTWTQTLTYHPHLHCIVPGGGLAADPASAAEDGGARWVSCRPGFFLPVRVLATVFRGKLLSKLERGLRDATLSAPEAENPGRLLESAARKKWNVYSKPSFVGPEQVIAYLGRYTHRIAISNERLVSMKEGQVTFRYKDRANNDHERRMTLPAEEFLRRYLQHVLPLGFVRLRYHGFLANSVRGRLLPLLHQLLGVVAAVLQPNRDAETWQQELLRLTGHDVTRCSHCTDGHLVEIAIVPPSPEKWSLPGRATSP